MFSIALGSPCRIGVPAFPVGFSMIAGAAYSLHARFCRETAPNGFFTSADFAVRTPRMTALMSWGPAGMPRYAAAGIAGNRACALGLYFGGERAGRVAAVARGQAPRSCSAAAVEKALGNLGSRELGDDQPGIKRVPSDGCASTVFGRPAA